jgi:hypothetical protein
MMSHSRPNNSLSKRDEDRLVEAGRRVLLDGGYPNPDRVGCPGSRVLKAIAERTMDLRQAQEWALHLGSCSPCFVEYSAFRKHAERRKTLELVLACVALLLVIGGAGWLWEAKVGHKTSEQPQPIALDLRNWVVLRGDQTPSANSGPIQLPRGRLDLTISLPSGSQTGNYEVQVSTESGKPLVNAIGNAAIENGVIVMKARVDLSKIDPGNYLLAIGHPGMERRSYPLVAK